mmetsp:Transcript_8450/g.15296  ORF Transcript_8450/g.15296 Transcript_8450/m.15296 type:complete len:396 (+) Transcript_8450:36-1223(+)
MRTNIGKSLEFNGVLKDEENSSISPSLSTQPTHSPQSRSPFHTRYRKYMNRINPSSLRICGLMIAWFFCSLLSLFFAKRALIQSKIPEDFFTAWLFFCSVFFGLLTTKVFRLQNLYKFSWKQLRIVLPLSCAYLVKEILKYASLGRISVNLFNAVRSLGPLFSITLEYILFRHKTSLLVLTTLIPIIAGVTLTSVDELHFSSINIESQLTGIFGLIGSILSTAINTGQNIYSKVLFGREKMDPVSLQIYLSGVSLALMSPALILRFVHSFLRAHYQSTSISELFGFPPHSSLPLLLLAGLINFLGTQFAFSTLSLVSPLSYSVANNFKRVCIPVFAVYFFHEVLGPLNVIGVLLSIIGIVAYERASRSYRQSKVYESGLGSETRHTLPFSIKPSS